MSDYLIVYKYKKGRTGWRTYAHIPLWTREGAEERIATLTIVNPHLCFSVQEILVSGY